MKRFYRRAGRRDVRTQHQLARPSPFHPLLSILRYVITGGLLIYLVWVADPVRIWEEWRSVHLGILLAGIVFQLLGVILSAAKWGILLYARGQQQPFMWLLRSYLVGQFANNFLPTGIGGDAVRALQLSRRIGSLSQATASVFLDRLTGFLALTCIANGAMVLLATGLVGEPLVTQEWLIVITVLVTFAAVGAVLVSLGAPWLLIRIGPWLPGIIRHPLETIAQALADYFPKGKMLLAILVFSFSFQSLWVTVNLMCGLALGIAAPWLLYALMATMTDILGLLPVFVNNMGARELVFTLYLSQIGVPPASALALAFLVLSVRLLVSVLGGVVLLIGGSDLRVLPGVVHHEP